MKNYFADCETLADLKKSYRMAAKKFHPDLGGSNEDMQRINKDHDERFEELKRGWNSTHEEKYQTNETAEEFRDIIEILVHLEGLEVELCGCWLWIGGDTKTHKDTLKANGCKWSSNKKLWYWHHENEGSHWHKGKKTMSQIRETYGSQKFSQQERDKLAS